MDNPRYDVVLGAILGLIGVALLLPSYREAAQVFMLPGDISPYFVPKIYVFCWIALSLAILAGGVVRLQRWHGDDTSHNWLAIAGAFAAAILATALMPQLGYLVVAPVSVFATIWLLGYRNHLLNGAVSIAVTAILYFMLSELAGLGLPSAFWQA